MLLMLAIYGVAAAAAPWLVGRLGTRAFVVLSVVPAAASWASSPPAVTRGTVCHTPRA